MANYFEQSSDWLAFDKQHLWHPYTSMVDPLPCYPVESAQGVRLNLATGESLIDGMSSWWSAIHGYNHPDLNHAAKAQIDQVSHVMFGGIAHQPAAELGKRLIDLTPKSLQHIFLADSGSIAIEVALKMAMQYWYSQGEGHRQRFMTIRGGYHGDPFACMSVCDPINGMHHVFSSILPKHVFANRPEIGFNQTWCDSDVDNFKALMALHHHELAGVILEPIVQGAGGMRFYHPEYLRQIRSVCDEYGLLLIFDEIATGFGRTGQLFALEHADVIPDILCVGKALTGGMMTLAATLANRKVAIGISTGDAPMLMHGPTFMANPLACAVANASIDLLLQSGWKQKVTDIEKRLQQLYEVAEHPCVKDVRVLGAIGVVEMKNPIDVSLAQQFLVDQGVWIRPFGRLLYIMPPFICTMNDIDTLCQAMMALVKRLPVTP